MFSVWYLCVLAFGLMMLGYRRAAVVASVLALGFYIVIVFAALLG